VFDALEELKTSFSLQAIAPSLGIG